MLILTALFIQIPISDATVDRYANLNNGEWTSEIDIIEEDPDYDETPEEDYSCGTRSQNHVHYFNTVDSATYEYRMAVYAFAIVLEVDYDNEDNPATDDFLSNVDTENLECKVGNGSVIDCGFDIEDDLGEVIAESSAYNGTTVTYQTLDFLPGNPRGLLWEYSTDSEGDLYEVPVLDGMASSSSTPENIDEYISFGLNNYSEQFTATTTSYALTAPMYVRTTADDGDLDNWNYLYTDEADPDGDGDSAADPDGDHIYWYGMNAILRSIFADCEEEVEVCTDLDIASPTSITAEETDEVITITIDADGEEGEADAWDGTYEYSSNGTCEFTTSSLLASWGYGSSTLETSSETVYVHSCTAGDTISVEEVDYPTACHDSLAIEDACEDLRIASPSVITVEDLEGTVEITIEADAASGGTGTWNGQYIFSATASDGGTTTGEFHRTSTGERLATNPYTTANETVYYFNGQPGDIITVEEVDYPSACNDTLTAEEEEILYCANLTVDPTTITAEEAEGIVTIDLSDIDQNEDDWDGTYTVSSDGTCEFTSGTLGYAQAALGFGSNPLETSNERVYAHSCTPGETISIEEVDYPRACAAEIPIEEAIPPYCGDGVLDSNGVDDILGTADDEACDDGNNTDGDSCSSTCEVEETAPYCGDGILDIDGIDDIPGNTDDEACDDGNTTDGDGCSSTCDVEETAPYCGDGIVDANGADDITGNTDDEACDDGNTTDGDGCSATCGVETTSPYCTALEITTPTSISTTDITGDVQIVISTTSSATGSWAGTYTYTAYADGGSTTLAIGTFGTDTTIAGTNPYTTTATTVYYGGGEEGDRIVVQETTYAVCNDSITADTTTTPACLGLSLSPENVVIAANTTVAYTITPNPTTWPGPYTWTTNNTAGVFTADNGSTTGNTITTADLTVEYNGEVNDVVTVREATTYGSVCVDTATLTSEGGRTDYCGDGNVNAGEDCDDGNTTDGDGCSSTCDNESTSGGCTSGCSGGGGGSEYCGDDIVQSPNDYGTYEECEPTGVVTTANPYGDICSDVCQIENVCVELDITPADGTTFSSTEGSTLEFDYQAYDYYGDEYTDEDYEWSTSNDSGTFNDGTDEDSELTTDETTMTYTVGDTDTTITVQVGDSAACTATYDIELPAEAEDTFEKFVYTYNFGFYEVDNNAINGNQFSYGHDFDYAFYTLAYTPDPNETVDEVTITDSIADGIQGTMADGTVSPYSSIDPYTASSSDYDPVRCWVDGDTSDMTSCDYEGSYRAFSVYYDDGTEIEACDTDSGEVSGEGNPLTIEDQGTTCFDGDITASTGVDLKNLDNSRDSGDGSPMTIAIRYLGQVDNGSFNCNDEVACPVLGFTNTAEVDGGRLEDSVDVTIICPYLLTRNSGDVYWEETLDEGFDLSCYYDQRNTDGLVFRLVDPSTWQTAACDADANNSLVDRFSSYICEVLVDVETVTEWSVETIKAVQDTNVTAITRYNDNLSFLAADTGSHTIENFADLNSDLGVELSNDKQNVYKISDADLHFDLGSYTVPSGAYTFIVENGDLYIDSNVLYDPAFDLTSVTDLTEIPSIAFIVLGGDIYVSRSVSKMVGVYYVEAREGVGGNLNGDFTLPFTPLEIYGSVYGNIQPLLEERTFSGPANYDHGNVVIRYDERILLNTPPGLEEFVDIESERAVR